MGDTPFGCIFLEVISYLRAEVSFGEFFGFLGWGGLGLEFCVEEVFLRSGRGNF